MQASVCIQLKHSDTKSVTIEQIKLYQLCKPQVDTLVKHLRRVTSSDLIDLCKQPLRSFDFAYISSCKNQLLYKIQTVAPYPSKRTFMGLYLVRTNKGKTSFLINFESMDVYVIGLNISESEWFNGEGTFFFGCFDVAQKQYVIQNVFMSSGQLLLSSTLDERMLIAHIFKLAVIKCNEGITINVSNIERVQTTTDLDVLFNLILINESCSLIVDNGPLIIDCNIIYHPINNKVFPYYDFSTEKNNVNTFDKTLQSDIYNTQQQQQQHGNDRATNNDTICDQYNGRLSKNQTVRCNNREDSKSRSFNVSHKPYINHGKRRPTNSTQSSLNAYKIKNKNTGKRIHGNGKPRDDFTYRKTSEYNNPIHSSINKNSN